MTGYTQTKYIVQFMQKNRQIVFKIYQNSPDIYKVFSDGDVNIGIVSILQEHEVEDGV